MWKKNQLKKGKPYDIQDTEHEINKDIKTLRKELLEKMTDDGLVKHTITNKQYIFTKVVLKKETNITCLKIPAHVAVIKIGFI